MIRTCIALVAAFFMAAVSAPGAVASPPGGTVGHVGDETATAPPFAGALKYPFTRLEAERCGRWNRGSQDYPYFGAPRNGNSRKHAGIDLYPVTGEGTPVTALRDGKVTRIAPFYKRRNGETTYAILVDHGAFVANYAELKKPSIPAGATVKRGQVIGFVSGTEQLHFELYAPGTNRWLSWRGRKPRGLIDPTDMMVKVFGLRR